MEVLLAQAVVHATLEVVLELKYKHSFSLFHIPFGEKNSSMLTFI